jgi:hypothetical protein
MHFQLWRDCKTFHVSSIKWLNRDQLSPAHKTACTTWQESPFQYNVTETYLIAKTHHEVGSLRCCWSGIKKGPISWYLSLLATCLDDPVLQYPTPRRPLALSIKISQLTLSTSTSGASHVAFGLIWFACWLGFMIHCSIFLHSLNGFLHNRVWMRKRTPMDKSVPSELDFACKYNKQLQCLITTSLLNLLCYT